MKRSIGAFFFVTCCFLFFNLSKAQTPAGNYAILQQVCDSNGILVVNVTAGMSFPLTFEYLDDNYFSDIVHSNINSWSDTLNNIADPIHMVFVTDTLGHHLYLYPGMLSAFIVDFPLVTQPVCPDTIGLVEFTINGGATPSSVQWYTMNFPYSLTYVTAGNPVSLPVGTYVATITDSAGCVLSYIDSAGIVISPESGISAVLLTTPANCSNGSIDVTNVSGGMPPYTYLWNNGANTPLLSNLLSGYYLLTITDAQGCSEPFYDYVPQTLTISVNPVVSPATCLGNNGSIISFASGGMPPYSYQYSNGFVGQTITGLTGGTNLSVTATDANGCTGNAYAYVGISTPITVTHTSTPSSCTSPTGSATLTISGGTAPYTVTWNSFPPQSGLTLNNVPSGYYAFLVSDAAGCTRSGGVTIAPQSIIYAYPSANPAVCPANAGSIILSVYGSNPPFTYQWNTGDTSQNLTAINAGNYSCTITDSLGCQLIKGTTVPLGSSLNIGFITTPASCIFEADGSIQSVVSGGAPPYMYYWSNGQTGMTATNLLSGYYALTVLDAAGCTKTTSVWLPYDPANDSCYCLIAGYVFVDQNGDCIYDSTESPVEHVMVHCSGMGYSFTDAGGYYSFLVPSGTYTLSESVQGIYPLAPCQNNGVPVSVTASPGCVSYHNFANVINPLHDIHILRTSVNAAVPGYPYYQTLIVENDGTVSEPDIQLGFEHDGQLLCNGMSPALFAQLSPITDPYWFSVNSGFPVLAPGASIAILATYQVPTNIPLATSVNFSDTAAYTAPMDSWLWDYTPWNNISNYNATVVGSYDPNFKEVVPSGEGPEGYITQADSMLTYVIHFQNTGSYPAQNIVIADTLDEDLDWATVLPGYANHEYSAVMSESGVLTFTFANINLVPQSTNELTSRGLVTFTVRIKNTLPAGTQIQNKAAICFDYNAPILTNTTLNTLMDGAQVPESISENGILVYPNPASTDLIIERKFSQEMIGICFYDIHGREIFSAELNDVRQSINIRGYGNGLYILKMNVGNSVEVHKVLIMHP